MTTAAAASAGSSSGPLLSEEHIFWIAIGLGIIALLIVLLPVWLARMDRWRLKQPAATSSSTTPKNFFEIPYMTWFLVHYAIPVVAILAIVLLGIDNVIDKGTVSALLGSLFGYVLGSSTHATPPSSSGQPKPGDNTNPSGQGP